MTMLKSSWQQSHSEWALTSLMSGTSFTMTCLRVLKDIFRTGERFGKTYVADVLTGSRNQKVLENRHDTIKTYGAGKEYPKGQWQSFTRELIQSGYLKLDGDKYPILKLNEKSRSVLFNNEKVYLTKPEERIETRKDEELTKTDRDYDRILFERLRTLRKTLADSEQR